MEPLSPSGQRVAKFYDPQYIFEEGPWQPGANEKLCAQSKVNEVIAYTLLRPIQGRDISVFYGEYSYARSKADIAVILLEHVTDSSISTPASQRP